MGNGYRLLNRDYLNCSCHCVQMVKFHFLKHIVCSFFLFFSFISFPTRHKHALSAEPYRHQQGLFRWEIIFSTPLDSCFAPCWSSSVGDDSSSSIDISAASRLCTTAWERITKSENIIIVGEIHAIIEYSTMTGVGLYQIPIMWKYVIIVESTR